MSQLFAKIKISKAQIFHDSTNTFCFVNLKPIVPFHVLVASKRVCPRLSDLPEDEYHDLWKQVRKVQKAVEELANCDSSNVAVQDGVNSGQSVPHVHVHILPRRKGDFERSDDVHEELDSFQYKDDYRKVELDNRVERTEEVMKKEAELISQKLNDLMLRKMEIQKKSFSKRSVKKEVFPRARITEKKIFRTSKVVKKRASFEWSPEVEESFRLGLAGWKTYEEYRAKYGDPDLWENAFIKCLQTKKNGYFMYFDETPECTETSFRKLKV
eukprot:maker-scaffold_18-snap-gene-3.4-mRNA-1 protein AED:0.05 eAED:0.05 QI:0/0/0/1/1/1/2/0/269